MQILKDLRIRAKLTIILLGTTFLTLLFSSFFFIIKDTQTFKTNLVNNLNTLAGVVGANSRSALEFGDPITAKNTLSYVKEEPQILFVALYDENGVPFASYSRIEKEPVPSPKLIKIGHVIADDHVEIFRPITLKGEKIGSIYLYSHLKDLQVQRDNYLVFVGLVMFVALLFSFFFSIRVQRVISDPILSLTNTAKLVATKSDYAIRVHRDSKDELGTLFDGFNDMLSQIQKGNLELRQYRDNLEQLVEERTEKLKTAQKELVQKERLALLGELSAKVAHELRNPLGTIRNVIFSISYSVPKNDKNSHNLLEMVERNIVRCNSIIEELLDFARPHSPKKEWVQIDKFLGEILNEQKLDNDFLVQESFNSKVSVLIYKERLRRAIINIIENSLQALSEKKSKTNKKGETISGLNLNINIVLNSNILEIYFIDTALGIPEEEFKNIFTPLYSTKSFGVGLGLPIVKEIMNQHQGGVEISSKINEGSTVKLWLPLFIKD